MSSESFHVRYLRHQGEELQVIPEIGYTLQASGDTDLESPEVGLSLSWAHGTGVFDITLNGSINASWIDVRSRGGREESRLIGWNTGLSIGRGSEEKLRTTVEVSLLHNKLRRVGGEIWELPDTGAGLERIGIEDARRARVSLVRRIRRWRLSFFGEMRGRKQEDFLLDPVRIDSSLLDFTITGPRTALTVNAGRTDARSTEVQKVDFLSASLHYRPTAGLSIRLGFLDNSREVLDAPDVDRRRLEPSAQWSYGRVASHLSWWLQEEFLSGSLRENRGLNFSISTRFDGWLPFLSAPKRRGVIR